jgi:hypothetical protein
MMKRTKMLVPGEIEWTKTGGGSLVIKIGGKSKIIKPGQRFFARREEIPEGFRNTIVPVRPTELEAIEKGSTDIEVVQLKYTVKHRSGGWYNVFDSNGKQVNEKAVKGKEAAEELISSLT